MRELWNAGPFDSGPRKKSGPQNDTTMESLKLLLHALRRDLLIQKRYRLHA